MTEGALPGFGKFFGYLVKSGGKGALGIVGVVRWHAIMC